MTFLDLKRLPVIIRANPHLIDYPTLSFSTFNSFPEEISSVKVVNAFKGLDSLKLAQNQSKLIAQSLGSVTIASRIMQILHMVMDQYVSFLEKALVASNQTSDSDSLQSALDFLKSEIGRRFLLSYIYKGFSSKSVSMGNADLRLVKFAGSVVDLLPAFCVYLDSGVVPESEITARSLLAMAKEFHAVAPELSNVA